MIHNVDALAAFLAGLLTFFTPCTLPLLPGWLALVAGLGHGEVLSPDYKPALSKRLGVLLSTILFVVGFSAVFISMGAAASALGDFLWEHQRTLRWLGAALMALFALVLLGAVKPPALMTEKRLHFSSRPLGLLGALLVGMAFAAGWTPCSGPVLAALLSLAATERNLARGTELLIYFSAGLGLPFVALSLMWSTLLPKLRRLSKYSVWAGRVLGVMLLFLAVLVFLDKLSWLSFGYEGGR
ncbi:MAG: cytochrome c biogenesis protein CcdA [Deltaproteobacteria bacterium]|jgi:cytochrome c-type biogenesis protein|nr:cytochrome c biogenesis protein CcdA [Deltaproteobacteria bacterium]